MLPTIFWPGGVPAGIFSVRWTPNSDFVILQYSSSEQADCILILDPKNGKIGKLMDGTEYGWFDKK